MNGNAIKVVLWGIIAQILDTVSDFRTYCAAAGVNGTTCDIMQKELNVRYNSFK